MTAVTFLLAYLGYLGLCATAVAHAAGHPARRAGVATAAVVLAHVVLVWHVRYHWSPTVALASGIAPFLVFHTALIAVCVVAVAPMPWSRWAVTVAFPVVTLGALGAVTHREVVAGYRWPVIALAAATVGALGLLALRARRRPLVRP